MPTKEEEFKERFIAMMQNLRTIGIKDMEAVWLTGSLAVRLIDRSRSVSWKQFKTAQTKRGFDKLLADFEVQGNGFNTQGKKKQAYAIQLLAMSLIVQKQKDPDLKIGEGLLDDMIDYMIDYYRKNKQAPVN
ncbi:hypothetical protein [Devosia sp.]|uniref:hypothetical protein n=1 Tax=Devosia sp. TaxID=1871048 RepID=UPI003BA87496